MMSTKNTLPTKNITRSILFRDFISSKNQIGRDFNINLSNGIELNTLKDDGRFNIDSDRLYRLIHSLIISEWEYFIERGINFGVIKVEEYIDEKGFERRKIIDID
jgi:hypothetical protein